MSGNLIAQMPLPNGLWWAWLKGGTCKILGEAKRKNESSYVFCSVSPLIIPMAVSPSSLWFWLPLEKPPRWSQLQQQSSCQDFSASKLLFISEPWEGYLLQFCYRCENSFLMFLTSGIPRLINPPIICVSKCFCSIDEKPNVVSVFLPGSWMVGHS